MIEIGSIVITEDEAVVSLLYIGYVIPIVISAHYWVKQPLLRFLPIAYGEFIALVMVVNGIYEAVKIIEILLVHVVIGSIFTIVSWLGWVEGRKFID